LSAAARPLRIGTRGSALARTQADIVSQAFRDRFPDREVEIVVIHTKGDQDQESSLASFGGQGVFVKAIEAQLLAGEIDAAVHSAKDLSSQDPEGIDLVAFLERGPVHDVLVRRSGAPKGTPSAGFRIATGSPRRRAQLADEWPEAEFVDIRGNIDTRLRKLEDGAADAIVLAAAGLHRLGLAPPGLEGLPIEMCVPAPGQGALVVQAREDDPVGADLRWLNHFSTALAVQCERDLAAAIGAGCSTALGAYVHFESGETMLLAALHDGTTFARVEARSPATSPADVVGLALAEFRDLGVRFGQ